MENNEKVTNPVDQRLDKECTCLFCGKPFRASEIEFCIEIPATGDFYDQVFEDHIRTYKGCEDREAPYRIWIDWNDNPENIIKWEDDGIPYTVRGPLRNITNTQASDFGFGMSLFGVQSEEEEGETESEDDKIWRRSSTRVCPHCHMTLPSGFASDTKLRVGLMGGPRSGKTTYMVVVAKYLQQRLHGMGNGIGLGTISMIPECEQCIDGIYENGVAPTVAVAGQEEDPAVLPIIMRITPSDNKYKPFCLILQDIPGEYMRPEPKFREMLSSSNIKESTDLIMLIDINHFIQTRQRREYEEKKNNEQFGEFCRQETHRLFDNMENLGMCLDPKELKSVQIALTKLDFWKEEDERIAVTAFGQSGDNRHKGAISESRLNQVNNQVRAVLGQMDGPDYSGLINVLLEKLNMKGTTPQTAYTAIASKTVPEHDDAFEDGTKVNYSLTLNVLEPLLNIFAYHNVLPVQRETIAIVPGK